MGIATMRSPTLMVRVDEQTHKALKSMTERTGQSMPQIVSKAVEAYRRQLFLEECNAAYSRLREDPQAWKEELEERALWDAALSDGLEAEIE
jgi:hypothetical protein